MSLFQRWTGAGTSPVDWCESNYVVTSCIAEFFNTISNFLFFMVPPATCHLWVSYAQHVTRGVYVVWVFFVVIGLSSAYFHGTLSFLGQMLDELSILWLLMVSYSLFTPLRLRPKVLRDDERLYWAVMAALTVITTVSAFFAPIVNAFALFLVGGPAVFILAKEVKGSEDPEVARLGKITFTSLALAILAWLVDRFLCRVCQALGFPFLHALWHILIFVSGYTAQVLVCYLYALQNVPESRPVLKYWSWTFVPYVHCQG